MLLHSDVPVLFHCFMTQRFDKVLKKSAIFRTAFVFSVCVASLSLAIFFNAFAIIFHFYFRVERRLHLQMVSAFFKADIMILPWTDFFLLTPIPLSQIFGFFIHFFSVNTSHPQSPPTLKIPALGKNRYPCAPTQNHSKYVLYTLRT